MTTKMLDTVNALQDEELTARLDHLCKPIVLIGLMGAGKTTVGKRLAKVINRQFVDSDEEIEDAAGCSISDIFAIHGEQIFRDLEYRVVHRLMDHEKLVLATGGGAWIQDKVREEIKGRAVTIWLRADLETLLERVERRNHRPLLETGDKRVILEKLMNERYPIYEKADIVIDSGDGAHELIVDAIIDQLAEYKHDSE
ncbi:MAG: shikimate kinase [Rickettsiales bacterium]|nr:shikimate kinase [Rickettsiales bacterium]